jgi:hypothetical protein
MAWSVDGVRWGILVRRHGPAYAGAALMITIGLGGCTASTETTETPGLEPRDTVLTSVKPTRQDLTNRISLTGKVTMNPVFGIVAPADGEVRYLQVQQSKTAPTKATKVATIWSGRKQTSVEVPAGALFAGRLVEDRSTVTAGMPIVSAKHSAYGIVADIDSAQAYRISGAIASVQAQIKNGPGPFGCTVLGTVAALPAGTIPEPPAPTGTPQPTGQPSGPPPGMPKPGGEGEQAPGGSEPTGLRLVCTAPGDVKLINGASVTLDVVTEKATNVLVLPVEAVAGTAGKGKVDVVGPDRTRQTKDVTLGLTDGKVVEIKSGLDGDETVAVPGPDLPTAAPGDQKQPGGAG